MTTDERASEYLVLKQISFSREVTKVAAVPRDKFVPLLAILHLVQYLPLTETPVIVTLTPATVTV